MEKRKIAQNKIKKRENINVKQKCRKKKHFQYYMYIVLKTFIPR